jgi:hypothetical protein
MNIKDAKIVGGPLVLAAADDVDAIESRLWIKLPGGYREYVTTLGEGVLGGSFIRVYPPWRIEKELTEWRQRIRKYWFWDAGRELLPKERALECVIIGDTLNGDELVFHPCRPDRLFVLPRDSEEVLEAGANLLAAIEWICGSGELTEPFPERNFEPFDSRKQIDDRGADRGAVTDPEGETLDDIVELGKRWAKRHGARKACQKDLKQYGGKEKSSKLVYEAIILDGEYPTYEAGYAVRYKVIDKSSGKELGAFLGHVMDGSSGYTFEAKSG